MLYLPLTKIFDSAESVVAAGVTIAAEGQALVRAVGAPASGVAPSAAATANEIFAGFAIAGVSASPIQPAYAVKVETFTVPVSGIVALAFTPVAGQLMAYDNTAGAIIATPTVVGATVTTLTAGNSVTVTYRYALTVTQARALVGDTQPGGYAGLVVGQIGVAKRGIIFTSEFDASKNYAVATSIKLAAGGQITDQTGTGATLTGAYVVSVPTADVPFLGIEFSAA